MKRGKTKWLVVHCSASQPLRSLDANAIRRWHKEKGWSDIGYHYVIKTDGTVEDGRDLMAVGAHVAGHNAESVGICMIGGVDKNGYSTNNFTQQQFQSLRKLLGELLKIFPEAVILGHRDFPNVKKDCPCFDVTDWWAGIKQGSNKNA